MSQVSDRRLSVAMHTENPSMQRLRQEVQEFKTSLGYMASMRLTWAMRQTDRLSSETASTGTISCLSSSLLDTLLAPPPPLFLDNKTKTN